jgi:hypothetical protein
MAFGSSGLGVAGWQAGSKFTTAACTNGMTPVSSVYELFDVGLYLDPLATGVAPRWEMPDEAQELVACRRYFGKYDMTWTDHVYASGAGVTAYRNFYNQVQMRITPAVTFTVTASNVTPGVEQNATDGFMAFITAAAAGPAYWQGMITVNARM